MLKGPADTVALTLTKAAEGAKVHGFAITAASATTKGGSSIAVAVEDIAAALIRCEVTAGDGMAGEDGLKASGTATKGMDAPPPDAKTMDACINGASMFLVGGIIVAERHLSIIKNGNGVLDIVEILDCDGLQNADVPRFDEFHAQRFDDFIIIFHGRKE